MPHERQRTARTSKAATPKAEPGSDMTMNRSAYERLRHMIVTLALHPGEKISEVRMMGMLGSGRAPARYAMQRLASERLLKAVPRGGTVIRPLVMTEVQQAYQVRTSLERLAVRLAARGQTPAKLKLMSDALAKAEAAFASGDQISTSERLHDFSSAIVAAGANEILEFQMTVVMAVTERFEYFRASQLKIPRQSLAEERRLLEAIATGDPDAAEAVVAEIASDRHITVAEMMDAKLVVEAPAGPRG